MRRQSATIARSGESGEYRGAMELPIDTTQLDTATLESRAGLRLSVLNLGATIHQLEVPTANGRLDAVLSYADVGAYASNPYFVGSTVGPFANRIRDARFVLDGKAFRVEANETATGHCLHGGSDGLHRQLFELQPDPADAALHCRCELRDGVGGFPGNRDVSVVYRWLDDASLAIDFAVTSDRTTVVSLATHAYFNLGGAIEDHVLRIAADAYMPTHGSYVPTGEIRSVTGTAFDFRNARALGAARIDHNFVLSASAGEPRLVAELAGGAGDVRLKLYTTQPGLQLYTGDGLGRPFAPRAGICLEPQGFPDAPNQPRFPSTRLEAGAEYRQRTIYAFDTRSPG